MTAFIVTDLGFGDSGKGTVTDSLVRETGADWVVRHNGGAQAGHNVVTADGRSHTFSQFGAGSFVAGVRTYLSRYMLVHPGGLLEEARVLAKKGVPNILERTNIDPQAKLITPFHQAANRLREVLRGDARHGSCGLGVGETVSHSLEFQEEAVQASDLFSGSVMMGKLKQIQSRYWNEFCEHRAKLMAHPLGAAEMQLLESSDAGSQFAQLASQLKPLVAEKDLGKNRVVFEGAQGVLLDEWRGFHPYTTWSTCTFDNALELAREWGLEPFRLGVIRSYATRHGAGPFPTEDASLQLPEPHNCWGPWQEGFRWGWLDLPLLRYAVEVCGGLDGLAVTHLDLVTEDWKICERYQGVDRVMPGRFMDLEFQEQLGKKLMTWRPEYSRLAGTDELLQILEQLGSIVLESWGPTATRKRYLTPLLSV